ncbi:MAG: hypothetical protein H6806_13805 [Planctomycetes bacterium]|nr:hypothetical protein [Planctomycetota bacterium]
MAQLAKRGVDVPRTEVEYRRKAMELAARLREADPDNPRYRIIEAFTVAYSGLAREPWSRAAVLDAWEHLVEAWDRLPISQSEVAILERLSSHALLQAQDDPALSTRILAGANRCMLRTLEDPGCSELLLDLAVRGWLLGRGGTLPSVSAEQRRLLHDAWVGALASPALALPPDDDDSPRAKRVRTWREQLAELVEASK